MQFDGKLDGCVAAPKYIWFISSITMRGRDNINDRNEGTRPKVFHNSFNNKAASQRKLKTKIKASQEFVLQCSPQNNAAGRVHSDFDGVYNNPLLLLMIYLFLINEALVMWRGVINGRAMAETVSTQLSLITGGTRTK